MFKKNAVQLIGNVGSEVEVFNPESGNKVAKCSLATNESYTNSEGQKVTETEWHNLVFFGKSAENAEKYISKGKQIAIQGKIKYKNYEDKEGIKRYSTDIVVNEVLFLDKKQ